MMTLMPLIKKVLDDAYAEIEAPDDKTKDSLIKKEIDKLSVEYANLTDRSGSSINYRAPLKRFAYIYKYTVAHADYIRQLISAEPGLRRLLAQPEFEVACLGGGPGSDLLGILKYLMRSGSKDVCFSCVMFDRERAWADSWCDVAKTVEAPFKVYPTFAHMDVADAETWAGYKKFLRADIFTLSFFLSELWRIKGQAEPFFDHCMSHMKPGAVILFVDNNNPRFYGWFDELYKKHGFTKIESSSGTLCFSNNEEKTDLGVYYQKFGWPKRESDAAWRIVKKV